MSTHVDSDGNVIMVDVSGKAATFRTARAEGRILVSPQVLETIKAGRMSKGDVLTVAQLAGIMGAKRTPDLIPLCHPLPLSNCRLLLELEENPICAAGADCDSLTVHAIRAVCEVKTTNQTGVEMEALTGVSVALLTVYDMCKGLDKSLEITGIRLLEKTGGKSGDFSRK
ncbi:MAG: cyclic pyranopterin monophosphate synthase MoaC [Deltaproteobacteria bacterium]|jgi:cyclic pyranopterin phosphate synthase|nr:cyclic pyranopterin monophosphate synthase MoaC [Deltaproteobacteria bacterium]